MPPATAASLLTLAMALTLGAPRAEASGGAPSAGGAAEARPTHSASAGSRARKSKKKGPRRGKARRNEVGKRGAAAPIDAHATSEKGRLTPPSVEQVAMKKAFAEHRQDQVADAERAARAATQDDRWHTVLFAIRELDSRSSTVVCFWRALAYYRLGELGRARKTRQQCELPPRDAGALDREDVASASLQPPGALPELMMEGEVEGDGRRSAPPVANPNPYAGPGPTEVR